VSKLLAQGCYSAE